MKLYIRILMTGLLALSTSVHAESPTTTLYLLGYDIPKHQRANVVAQDIAAFEKYQQKRIDSTFFNQTTDPTPKSKRDDYPSIDIRDMTLCDINASEDCLTQISKNPKPYRQSIKKLKPVLIDIDKLRQSDSRQLKSIFPSHLQLLGMHLPSYQMLPTPLLTKNALAYHDSQKSGNSEQVSAQICEDIAFGKSLITSQQSLISSMIGKSILHSQLDILATSSNPLPQNCKNALQPMTTDNISMCPLVKSENQPLINEIVGTASIPILFSRRASIKQINQWERPYCKTTWLEKVAEDLPMQTPTIEEYSPILFNRIGSDFLNLLMPNYTFYQHNLQDANAHLRLWQAALDPQCTSDIEHHINSLDTQWHPARNLHLDEKKYLTINTYDTRRLSKLSVSCKTLI
ncbi:hypothetical protein [Psychrobacter sp. AOP7-B1-24]|uniref:hypothetical protein n=1 Tax=Psychrobacter sp. AOP7-B1-24 TaxID=3457645 RepID=UPI00402B1B90